MLLIRKYSVVHKMLEMKRSEQEHHVNEKVDSMLGKLPMESSVLCKLPMGEPSMLALTRLTNCKPGLSHDITSQVTWPLQISSDLVELQAQG